MLLTVLAAILVGLVVAWLAIVQRHSVGGIQQRTLQQISDVLPQTQCRQCGYDGCTPYAEAIVYANESIALCPPGGAVTRQALARMLGRDPSTAIGANDAVVKRIAVIVEADCIGCTKCIQVCPVGAIVGATARMHTVVSNWCTGCDLCAPVCPTYCIEMHEPIALTRGVRDTAPLPA